MERQKERSQVSCGYQQREENSICGDSIELFIFVRFLGKSHRPRLVQAAALLSAINFSLRKNSRTSEPFREKIVLKIFFRPDEARRKT